MGITVNLKEKSVMLYIMIEHFNSYFEDMGSLPAEQLNDSTLGCCCRFWPDLCIIHSPSLSLSLFPSLSP